jgi:PAS domain S-box-containing protein
MESSKRKRTRGTTRQKKVNEPLGGSEAKYQALFHGARDGIILIDRETGAIVDCNPAFEHQTGRQLSQLKKMKIWQVRPPKKRAAARKKFLEVKGAGAGSSAELELQKPDGEIVYIEFISSQIRIRGREYLQSIARDITQHRRIEAALKNTLKEYKQRQDEISALLEGSRAVLQHRDFDKAARAIFGSCKKLIGATAGYVALLGKDGTENKGLFLDTGRRQRTVDPSLTMPIRGLPAQVYRTGKVAYENDFDKSNWPSLLPQGHAGLKNVLLAPLLIEGKVLGLLGLANKPGGFTENNARIASAFGELAAVALRNCQALDMLESSEARLRSIAETAGDAIISANSQDKIVLWNKAAEEIFGYPADEIIGQPITRIIHQQFHRDHQKGLRQVASTGKTKIIGKTVEVLGLRKDGSEFPMELSLATWKIKEESFFTAILRDITERKRVERLKDEFIGLVSHELRSPLTVVMGALGTLQSEDEYLSPAEKRQLLQDAIIEAESLSHLLGNLLELSRAQASRLFLHTEPISLKNVVVTTVEQIKRLLSAHRFIIDLPRNLPPVYADQVRLERILYNLMENAAKYSPNRGEIRIFARPDANNQLVIGVSDQGIGILPREQAELFKPFHRLKRSSPHRIKGAGLGLLVCRRLVEAHGGRIWVESGGKDSGSTFLFTLPVEKTDDP